MKSLTVCTTLTSRRRQLVPFRIQIKKTVQLFERSIITRMKLDQLQKFSPDLESH